MEPSRQADPPPSPIADSLSIRGQMISIGVIDQHSFTRDCIGKSIKGFDGCLEVISFTTAEDCLRSSNTLDLVLYHAHESVHDTKDTRLAPIRNLSEIAPVIILSAADNPESLIEAFESGARGYIPTASTPAELVVEIIRLVRAGGTFVPPSSLHLQGTTGKSLTPRTAMNQQFTPRQIAVLTQLTQGKANKIIAYELAMSESTVKVHIRNIMKKMNASNRTEVACRAQALATFEGHLTGTESGEPLHEVRRSPMSGVAAGH
jgi:DNA-binding NarL/FixJ family response regulator